MKCQRCLNETEFPEGMYRVDIAPSGGMVQDGIGKKFHAFSGYFCIPCTDELMAGIQKNRLLAMPKTESEVIR